MWRGSPQNTCDTRLLFGATLVWRFVEADLGHLPRGLSFIVKAMGRCSRDVSDSHEATLHFCACFCLSPHRPGSIAPGRPHSLTHLYRKLLRRAATCRDRPRPPTLQGGVPPSLPFQLTHRPHPTHRPLQGDLMYRAAAFPITQPINNSKKYGRIRHLLLWARVFQHLSSL